MGKCKAKRVTATKLCTGDLRHPVELQSRSLDTSGFASSQPVEVFTTLRVQWCAIETVSGVSRYGAVNIEDGVTHLFWCKWDIGLTGVDYILHDARRFKVMSMDNLNERDTTVVFQTKERGDVSLDASEA